MGWCSLLVPSSPESRERLAERVSAASYGTVLG